MEKNRNNPRHKLLLIRLILSVVILAQFILLLCPLSVFAFEDILPEELDQFDPLLLDESDYTESTVKDILSEDEALFEDPLSDPDTAILTEEAALVTEGEETIGEEPMEDDTEAEHREHQPDEQTAESYREGSGEENASEESILAEEEIDFPEENPISGSPACRVAEIEYGCTRYRELFELLSEQCEREALSTRFFDVIVSDNDPEPQTVCLEVPKAGFVLYMRADDIWEKVQDYVLTEDSLIAWATDGQVIALVEEPEEETAEELDDESSFGDAANKEEGERSGENSLQEQSDDEAEQGDAAFGLLGAISPSATGATNANYTTNRLTVTAEEMDTTEIVSMEVEVTYTDGTVEVLTLDSSNGWKASCYGATANTGYNLRVTAAYDACGNDIHSSWNWTDEAGERGEYTEAVGEQWVEKDTLSDGTFVFQFDLNGTKALLAGTKTMIIRNYYALSYEMSDPDSASLAALWTITKISGSDWQARCQGTSYMMDFMQDSSNTFCTRRVSGTEVAIIYDNKRIGKREFSCYGCIGPNGASSTGTFDSATEFTALKLENVTYSGTEQKVSLGHEPNLEEEENIDIPVSMRIEGALCDRSLLFDFTVLLNGELYESFSLGHGESHVIRNVPVGSVLTVQEQNGIYSARSECGDMISGADFTVSAVPSDLGEILFINRLDGIIDCGYETNPCPELIILSLTAIGILHLTVQTIRGKNRYKSKTEKEESMKKVIAILLTMLVCFSLSATAMAEADASFKVKYTMSGGTEVPDEELAFTVEAAADNPDTKSIILGTPVTAAAEADVTVTYPAYELPGLYKYVIRQTAGSSQGAVYDDGSIAFQVLFGYGQDGNLKVIGSGAANNGTEKKGEFGNSYYTGSLEVTAVTNGTAPDKDKEFNVTVSFEPETGKTVAGTISYTVDGIPLTVQPGWSDSREISFAVKDGDTITFTGVPFGMTYTVSQTAEAGYENTITPSTGSISAATTTVTVTNTDGTALETGIHLDSLPYLILLAAVISGFFILVLGRRKEEDDE